MSNCSSKYKEDVIRLSKEGKTYLQIMEILGCSKSTASYYSSNKQQENARQARKDYLPLKKDNRKKGVIRNREYVYNFLKGKKCIDCGNEDTRVLEFDHVRGIKSGHISHAVKNAWNINRLQEEIEKCEIRCCNCHRIVTIERRNINKI